VNMWKDTFLFPTKRKNRSAFMQFPVWSSNHISSPWCDVFLSIFIHSCFLIRIHCPVDRSKNIDIILFFINNVQVIVSGYKYCKQYSDFF